MAWVTPPELALPARFSGNGPRSGAVVAVEPSSASSWKRGRGNWTGIAELGKA